MIDMTLYSVLLSTISLLTCAPLSSSAPASLISPSANASLSSTPHCSSSLDWVTERFQPKDCNRATDEFFVQELLQWGETPFEFMSARAHPVTPLQSQALPRKYTHGELKNSNSSPQSMKDDRCTLKGLAMLIHVRKGLAQLHLQCWPPSVQKIYPECLYGDYFRLVM